MDGNFLGEMRVTNYPPTIKPPFYAADPPMINNRNCNIENIDYFNRYRNENLSKFQMPTYQWGFMDSYYNPKPRWSAHASKNMDKYLNLPRPRFTMLDAGRMFEIDDFYKVTQMHRDQLKDYSGRLHPLKHFTSGKYMYACPDDPTSTYFKFPKTYTKYRDPIVLPLTLERTYRSPMLPDRALTGRFNPQSDISYKK